MGQTVQAVAKFNQKTLFVGVVALHYPVNNRVPQLPQI